MNANKKDNKIIILGIILLILAGIIVVLLKGFNVSLMFGKHESVEIKVGADVDMTKIKEICDETFENKQYVIKELEVFGDSVQINVQSITDEEKNNLVNKINEKFGVSKTVEDLNITPVSNIRIREVIKPYITPMIITLIIVYIYILIRFRKINGFKIVLNSVCKLALLEAIYLSIIAVTRIPVNDIAISLTTVISIVELVYCIGKNEKKLDEIDGEKYE